LEKVFIDTQTEIGEKSILYIDFLVELE